VPSKSLTQPVSPINTNTTINKNEIREPGVFVEPNINKDSAPKIEFQDDYF
jgi:hypothetical protein